MHIFLFTAAAFTVQRVAKWVQARAAPPAYERGAVMGASFDARGLHEIRVPDDLTDDDVYFVVEYAIAGVHRRVARKSITVPEYLRRPPRFYVIDICATTTSGAMHDLTEELAPYTSPAGGFDGNDAPLEWIAAFEEVELGADIARVRILTYPRTWLGLIYTLLRGLTGLELSAPGASHLALKRHVE